ncbi:DUF541 domain-containing protein [Methanoculleus sp. FWC-SCC1]|uniref:DUF541 domain-containing protein n=1 Tax=Methanoculleus frigidifontis TaxID=2584085 RepID=A0ABT8M819_9EURY|nr:SIMPL domain-containing protein [Methanoculleus sp. FWC-SCC1]MDN7024077.1 DUF541 domain-containing protein [Methanoculleus sp. FWC-SCC1]
MRGKLALLIAALLVLSAAAIGSAAAQVEEPNEKLIYASGTGKVTTTPDQAVVALAVQTENADVTVAQQMNAEQMDAVINAVKAAGIPAEKIKTTGYSVTPVTEDSGAVWSSAKVKYYRVTNTVRVTLDDVTRVGEIIDLGIANGANRVDYISFTVSDETQQELRSQALTAAVRQARSDADAVAAALGKTIIDVREVNIGSNYIPLRYDSAASYAGGMEKAAGVPTPIEVGEMDVTATVSVTYIIN